MAKKNLSDTTKAKKPMGDTTRYSVLTPHGSIPTRKIDSVKKANPFMGKAIGKPYKGSGGMDTYGNDQSDLIKKAVKTKK